MILFKKGLPGTPVMANNINLLGSKPSGLTENRKTQCHALNMAFFVPKIYQAWYSLKGIKVGLCNLGTKNNALIFGAMPNKDGLKHGIKDPLRGNKCNRLAAISNTRPPAIKAGWQILLKPQGGQPMPNTSKRAIIRTIQAIHTPNGIKATILTRYNQKAVIGRLFTSVHQLRQFMQSQGVNPSLISVGVA